jgi:hydroxylamine reductase
MFCYQCEQTAKGEGCTKVGVCGKQPEASALQDLLVYTLEELGFYAVEARKLGILDKATSVLTIEGLFHTLTNVDFDPARLKEMIDRTVAARNSLIDKIKAKGGNTDFIAAKTLCKPESTI